MGQWGEEVEVKAVFNGKGYRVRLIPHFETEAFRPISKDSTLESVVVVNVEKEAESEYWDVGPLAVIKKEEE